MKSTVNIFQQTDQNDIEKELGFNVVINHTLKLKVLMTGSCFTRNSCKVHV